uniref:Uncharacterized protein n=1 Tax=Piliocolobus tephrosceles TaxID=591936 RepID=A0A8C9LUN9_9PRIM
IEQIIYALICNMLFEALLLSGRAGEEGQGGGLPQGDAGAAPVRLQQRRDADPILRTCAQSGLMAAYI